MGCLSCGIERVPPEFGPGDPVHRAPQGGHILPFSFGEYRSYFGEQGAVDDDFDGFIRRGGLARSYDYDDISESYGYIRDVYKTILTRDLVQKFSLPDSTVLERLAEYMMDNSGNLNSPNNIANVLDANRVPTNHVTVGRYISYLRDAFVFYEARRYDIKGKKYLSTQAKHYACDSGMHYAVLGTRDMDWGRMHENAVFLELMRRGYEAYVGKLYQKEVDFVAKRGSELVYIQVSDDISSESTLERELAPLLSVRDAFPKAPHRPHEARALYPGGRVHAGSREVAARRAGVLSVAWGYRGILPDKKKPRETPPALGSLPNGKPIALYYVLSENSRELEAFPDVSGISRPVR